MYWSCLLYLLPKIERHWPDLRGLKLPLFVLVTLNITLLNWKTLTRFKGIETLDYLQHRETKHWKTLTRLKGGLKFVYIYLIFITVFL